jgi:DNA-binding MarR family transcriptional regulator
MQHLINMSKNNIPSDQIRLLLALSYLGGEDISKSQWLNLFKRKSEKVSDMQTIADELEKKGAIKIQVNKSARKVSLLPEGQIQLREGILNNQLVFSSNTVTTKFVKALIQWLQNESQNVNINNSIHQLTSYVEFKAKVLQAYEKLNLDYKFGDLVPIYRLRRQIGATIDRQHFDEWLLEMQADDILQLLEGSVEDSAPDKLADSIRTQLSGLRCYARKI